MNSLILRQKFIDFFKSKKHVFKPSSPIVIKNDPSLFFVNAGMNQFKDIFLGNQISKNLRVVNSQKCLRVSGKHNDLEEVGHDTYHHTMFEMLGNWSFGDYFKEEAINLAWDFLTNELKISDERLYVSFFSGDTKDGLISDENTKSIWQGILSDEKIVSGSKKDNFWEMGKTGPCGPSTEIHIDLRSDSERKKVPTSELINKDHPLVIEIWNIVFIEFNRKENGQLENLPNRHVDTGMGFERLCMVLQDKKSTYDTDIFQSLIQSISNISQVNYGETEKTDIAIRVIVDHIRAITFSIADGQLPSNTGAGYVIRRILRRAVRYGFTYLDLKGPFLFKLIESLVNQFKTVFPEVYEQRLLIENVVEKEEKVFLKTLGKGLDLINSLINTLESNMKIISGKIVFELYDTYGFPPDLTTLILKEKGLSYNKQEFNQEMEKQKNRSRTDSEIVLGDWIEVNDLPIKGFLGYDLSLTSPGDLSAVNNHLVKYRQVFVKGDQQFHLVFPTTPFYPEGGGQVGDRGVILPTSNYLKGTKQKIEINVLDTKKENNLILHIVSGLADMSDILTPSELFILVPNSSDRMLITRNHSATHLLHYELRKMFGNHVEQRGSYVCKDYLRFDFSHFEKISEEQLVQLEKKVNEFIHTGFPLKEFRDVSFEEAKNKGALALFGEKYEEKVRVIQFGETPNRDGSIELCGGTHVQNTAEIGLFKIISESSIASGIRRIEAVTSNGAIQYYNKKIKTLSDIQLLLKSSDNVVNSVTKLIAENKKLSIKVDKIKEKEADHLINHLLTQILEINGFKVILNTVDTDVSVMKNICFQLIEKFDNMFVVLIKNQSNKLILNLAISKQIVQLKNIQAPKVLDEVGKYINAKGGGQPFFVVASGDIISGVNQLFEAVKKKVKSF